VAVVANDGRQQIEYFRWGLVPSWAKDVSIGTKLINARAETVAEKPSFRTAFKRRRCLIPASGFYEWQRNATGNAAKQPYFLRRKDKKPFAFAGLWETWRAPDGSELPTCTIITTKPNALVQQIHDRMAVILREESFRDWIDPSPGTDALLELLTPFPADLMEMIPVSRAVNTPRNDGPELIAPVSVEPGGQPGSRPNVVIPRKSCGPDTDQPTLF